MRTPRATNRPGDYVHHIFASFGWLVLPWTRGRWVLLRRHTTRPGAEDCRGRPLRNGWGLRLVRARDFHNCTATRVY